MTRLYIVALVKIVEEGKEGRALSISWIAPQKEKGKNDTRRAARLSVFAHLGEAEVHCLELGKKGKGGSFSW